MTFRLRHLVAALILHLLLFGLLAGGAQCSNKVVRPPPIQGVLLDASREQTAALKKKREEQAEKKKRAEEAEKKKQEEIRKQKEVADKKKAADDLKARQVADAKKKKTEDEKKKKETTDKKRTEEMNKKKKQQDEEKEKTLAAQRDLQDKARLEDEMRQESLKRDADREASARAASEKGRKQSEWAALLRRAVAKNWTRPAAATQDFSCTVHVLLLPDGSVSAANVAKSCGSASLDKSVEDAVYRASPLPKPDDPSIFDRDLIINFIPGNEGK